MTTARNLPYQSKNTDYKTFEDRSLFSDKILTDIFTAVLKNNSVVTNEDIINHISEQSTLLTGSLIYTSFRKKKLHDSLYEMQLYIYLGECSGQ